MEIQTWSQASWTGLHLGFVSYGECTLSGLTISQLPHKTGSQSFDHSRDEVVLLTRSTLINLGISNLGVVVDSLVKLLEDLSRLYKDRGLAAHPVHVFCSELYILELLAECLSTHWDSTTSAGSNAQSFRGNGISNADPYAPLTSGKTRHASRNKVSTRSAPLEPLQSILVHKLVEVLKLFTNPVPENHTLPSQSILDDVSNEETFWDDFKRPHTNGSNVHEARTETSMLLQEHSETIESCVRSIMEYISFSNWPQIHEKVKAALRGVKATQPQLSATQANIVPDDDRSALTMIRLISYLWVDSRMLSLILQEMCGCFLHLRKPFQTTVAIVVPLLITRWLERNPQEFTELHRMDKRLDGGADTLFDMANSMVDGTRRKALLYPFQTSLVLLLPDVFEVASHMREVKSASTTKKVSFLDLLRKSLRNRNETAIYCLTQILRVARLFRSDSDAAVLSFALDVQDDVREAVFRRTIVGGQDVSIIENPLTTAVIVSLAYLHFQTVVENLAPFCLAPMAPQDFKISLIAACTHFARQANSDDYQPLFARVADYMRKVMRVCLLTYITHVAKKLYRPHSPACNKRKSMIKSALRHWTLYTRS